MSADNDLSENPVPAPKRNHWVDVLSHKLLDQQRAFFDVRVRHPAMKRLLDDLMPLLMPHSESNIIIITGATGVGKSLLTRVLLKSLFEDFAQLLESDQTVIPLVSVEAYANGDTRHGFKTLYEDLGEQLLEPGAERKSCIEVHDGKMVNNPQAKWTIPALRKAVERALRMRKTRVCVIDEAAQLMRFGKETAVMDTLKSMSNTAGVKWVLVGSFDLYDLIADHGQIARRTTVLCLDRYHLEKAEDRAAFKDVVKKLQAKWPCEEVPNFVAISDELLEVALGCVGLLKSLMLDASAMQLRNGGKWDPDGHPNSPTHGHLKLLHLN
jgi:nucleoside-triphosphatase THEP1